MERNRLEAFSDGVIAIAITLLVLDIKVPLPHAGGPSLGVALARQWPVYAAYVISFLTVGVIWINHHATIRRLREVDHGLLVLNLLLLMAISILPWTTSLLAEYLLDSAGGRLAAAVYGGSMLLLTAVFYGMQRYILFGRHRLLLEHVDEPARRQVDRHGRLGLLPYLAATAGAAVSPFVTLAICAVVAIHYALPTGMYGGAPARQDGEG